MVIMEQIEAIFKQNENFLRQNKIVAIFKNGKRRTIRILDPDKLEQVFFERG